MSKFNIYHQCGHRYNWNFDLYRKNHIGNGFILSPYNMQKEFLSSIEDDELKNSFFDPQFYALGIYRDAYLSYNFLDCIDNISDYINDKDYIAKKTIEFQNNIEMKYITIPTIDFDLISTNDDYEEIYSHISNDIYAANDNNLKLLNEIIIKPFINYIEKIFTNKKVLLTVIFDENLSRNTDKFNELVTLITSYDRIDGIYLIPKCSRSYKRVSNIQFLIKMMELINILKEVKMEVIVGNSDIESILYLVAGADAITIGSYENLRHYDGARFTDNDQIMRGPVPRMFSYKLLQWIDYAYLYPMRNNFDMSELFDENEYYNMTKPEDYKWHFNKAEPYKHYMVSYCKLLDNLPENTIEKIEYVNQIFEEAKKMNKKLEECGIILDDNSGGAHISQWQTVLLQYKNKFVRE